MALKLPGTLRSIFPFLLASASLALILWAAIFHLSQPYDGIDRNPLTGKVYGVDPAGPAGKKIQAGDVILAINDVRSELAPSVYADLRAGDHLRIVLSRQGSVQSVNIALVNQPLGVALARLSPLLVAATFWLAGLGVMAFGHRGILPRLFFAFSIAVSSALATGSLSAVAPAWSSTVFNILVWFTGPLTVHLHWHFPEEKPFGGQKPHVAPLYAAAAVGSLPFALLGSDGVRASAWNQVLFAAGRLYLAICLLIAVIIVLNGYRAASTVQARQRIRLVALGGGVSLLLAIVLTIFPGILLSGPLVPYEYGFLFMMAIPLSYGYAIIRHRLIQIEAFLSRGAAYSLVFSILAGIYLALTSLINRFLPPNWMQLPFVNMLLVLALAGTAVPIYRRIQTVVDWAFYGGWYDYRSAVERITEGLESYRDIVGLGSAVTERLRSVLRLNSACVFVNGNEGMLSLLSTESCMPSQGEPGHAGLSFPIDGALAGRLRQRPEPRPAEVVAEALADTPLARAERLTLQAMRGSMLVPVLGSDMLLGVLALGARRGGEGFSAEDLGILSLVARHTASAIENVRLLREIQLRAAEVDRLHKQLLRAREDERRILARELHDEAIQALVGLNYKLAQLRSGRAAELQSEVRKIVEDLRIMIRTLRPPALDNFGLATAIRSHLRELSVKTEGSIRIDLQVNGDEEHWFPEDIGLCLYRVMQEALANVAKHADAARVEVVLDILPETACLTVRDDGRGFRLPQHLGQLLEENHFGLLGLRERLELVQGNLEITTAPGEGTRLRATVPLH